MLLRSINRFGKESGRRWTSTVGILGMGRVGSSFAASAVECGKLKVNVVDTAPRVDDGIKRVEDLLTSRGTNGKNLRKISFVEDAKALAKNSDFIIDALEPELGKAASLRVLAHYAKTEAPIAVACMGDLSVTKLASNSEIASRIVGVHCFREPHESSVAEVVKGLDSSDEAVKQVIALMGELGKRCVVCKDSPGFISERLLITYINEAAQALGEGISSPEDVDLIMSKGTAEMMTMKMLYEKFCDSRYRPAPILVRYVEGNRLGKKSGRGFYVYDDQEQ